MAQIFPKWSNKVPAIIAMSVLFGFAAVIGGIWYFGSPEYTDVGYRPQQPVPYSHKLHAGDLGIDCRYCHTTAEVSPLSVVPPTQTCMNCHKLIKTESEKLQKVRESFETGTSLEWIRVHNLPDYAYFNHSAHVSSGVSCISCHGNVAQMEIVTQVKPLSMSWCLDCHRNPGPNLRPVSEVTNMNWVKPENHTEFAAKFIIDKKISPPTDCSGCHR